MIPGIAPAAVRGYDIRGRYGDELTDAGAHALGLAVAGAARARGLRRIAVGRDGRLSSSALEAALVDGLKAGGAVAVRLGLCPTPMVAFACHELGLDGGVMVTGSHNPADENGFKLSLGGEPLFGQPLAALLAAPAAPTSGGRVEAVDLGPAYAARLARAAAGMPPLKVAWDCGHGAAGPTVRALTPRLPGEHLVLFAMPDGRFPAHHPDPSVPANLAALIDIVRREGCDLGLAFDGDGDRVGAVDRTGRIVWPDQLLLLLARDLLARQPGATVVADVKSSALLFDGIRAAGGRALMGPSGYVRLRAAMQAEGAPLAGEMSGHIFMAEDWIGSDDGLHAAARVLAALGRLRLDLAEFVDSLPPAVASPEWRIAVPEARKSAILAETAARLAAAGSEVDRTDGLRVTRADGWWLLRASGTEPKLTARAEAADEAGLERLRAEVAAQLRASGVEWSP